MAIITLPPSLHPQTDSAWPLLAVLPHFMVFDLGRIEVLLDLLGNPQRAYPSVHLTGTNGKTTTARMLQRLPLANATSRR